MNFGTTSTIVHAYFGVYLFSPCFRWHLTAFYGSVCSFCSQFDLNGLNKDTFIEYGYNCHYFVNWFFSYFVRVMYWKEFITFENSGAVKLGYSWFELARIFNILSIIVSNTKSIEDGSKNKNQNLFRYYVGILYSNARAFNLMAKRIKCHK